MGFRTGKKIYESIKDMIFYSITRGEFRIPGIAGQDQIIGGCYAGGGPTGDPAYRNNPLADAIKDLGPLPRGLYTIGLAETHARLGMIVMPLTPDKGNAMYGRCGFYIHGDNVHRNFTASDGCIVTPHGARIEIANLTAWFYQGLLGADNHLTVTA